MSLVLRTGPAIPNNKVQMYKLASRYEEGPVCRMGSAGELVMRLQLLACVGALALLLGGCDAGGSASSTSTQNPVPALASITPSSAPAGGNAFTLTVNGANFISSSVVRWNGSDRATTFVSSAQLRAAITAADLSSAGTVTVNVFNPAPGGGTSGNLNFAVTSVLPLSVLTTHLPSAQHGKAYSFTLQAGGGISPYTWSVASGSLPGGLSLSAGGVISGTPTAVVGDTVVNFEIQVTDSAYQPHTAVQPLNILVLAAILGRNDTCAAATPISNGIIRASISPYGDIDVYAFQGTEGQHVTLEVYAQRLSTNIFLDSFLELLDSGCSQRTYNDDISLGIVLDSLISDYTLPYTGTYYIRVSDLRGDGRPDFIYDLHLSGAD